MSAVITIDGPAGAGKTTTARGVAERLGYRYLDSGALYRALALAVLRAGASDAFSEGALEAVRGADVRPIWRGNEMLVLLDGAEVTDELRTPAVTRLVSPLSTIPEVRDLLLPIQREAGGEGRLVVDGRDTGSVVFPGADLKIYLVADLDERVRRRRVELASAGIESSTSEVRQQIEERDRRDTHREVAPLLFPDDGIEVNTTGMTVEGQIEHIVALARERGV